jgi:hypothetical protein
VALVLTLPSSTLEHYDEQATRLFEQLQKISGRVEKIFTPVKDEEIGAILRRRLFARVDDQAAAEVVHAYVEQAEQEALVARGEESAAYRARFKQTYPFLPEVVDVLYHRWGSFPTFQRTRGTLRLLALVVHALKTSPQACITLADFPLQQDDIRREVAQTHRQRIRQRPGGGPSQPRGGRPQSQPGNRQGPTRGWGWVNASRPPSSCTPSWAAEARPALPPTKSSATPSPPACRPASSPKCWENSAAGCFSTCMRKAGRYYFSTTANLKPRPDRPRGKRQRRGTARRRTGSPAPTGAQPGPENLLVASESRRHPRRPGPPKLLILPEADAALMERFLNEKGQTPRVHRNTLFFLVPSIAETAAV